jgi:chemotaxis protein MotB
MRPCFALLGPIVLVGCVSQAKYDDLKAQYDRAQDQLGERQQRIGVLGASASEAQAQNEKLKHENQRAQQQLAMLDLERTQLQAEQHRLTTDLTSVLEDRTRLKESTEQLKAALAELSRRKTEADRRVLEFRGLLARFKGLIDAGTLKVTIADGRMVLQLPTDVLFDSGSAKLSQVGKDAINQVSAVLKEVPDRRYQVEGHTDNVPIHNPQYRSNWELAAARGLGVLRAMSDAGIAAQQLSAASYAEFHPTATNDTDAGRRENRRIEIILVPDLSMLPGYEQLQSIVAGS